MGVETVRSTGYGRKGVGPLGHSWLNVEKRRSCDIEARLNAPAARFREGFVANGSLHVLR